MTSIPSERRHKFLCNLHATSAIFWQRRRLYKVRRRIFLRPPSPPHEKEIKSTVRLPVMVIFDRWQYRKIEDGEGK